MSTSRKKAQQLAQEYVSKGEPTGWFEPFYAQANGESSAISWAGPGPQPESDSVADGA